MHWNAKGFDTMIKGMRPTWRAYALGLALLAGTAGTWAYVVSAQNAERVRLADVERQVDQRYDTIKHVSAGDVAKLMKREPNVVVFDVRKPGEYAVSRIAGATRVDPGISKAQFMARFADKLRGKKVVFYCSVGVRSSRLAERVGDALSGLGVTYVANMRGGIFRWHNQSRPLENDQGRTPFVHPYDKTWGRYVERNDLTRMTVIKP